MNQSKDVQVRQRTMSVLARASSQDLEGCLQIHMATETGTTGWPEGISEIRSAESGLALVRGRIGGTGQAFNCGEMTMSRCAVQHGSGLRGFGYVTGRHRRHAELAAIFDLLAQLEPVLIEKSVIAPLEQKWLYHRREQATRAAATKVNFMTMVRGED